MSKHIEKLTKNEYKFDRNEEYSKSYGEIIDQYIHIMFRFKDLNQNEENKRVEEKYIKNLNYSFDILQNFKPDQNFKSENRYFNKGTELSNFIKFCQINMVPVIVSWCSNIHGLGIR